MTHVIAQLVTDMSCGNMGQYQLNSNICVCVRACVLFKYEAVKYFAVLQEFVTFPTPTR